MKKIICLLVVILCLTGCQANYDYKSELLWDSNGYNYAIIKLQNGEIVEGYLDTWRDFEDGEQLEVKINGTLYLTNSIKEYDCCDDCHKRIIGFAKNINLMEVKPCQK